MLPMWQLPLHRLSSNAMMDLDAPIPYTVTAKGRAALELALIEDAIRDCHHHWSIDPEHGVMCANCGFEQRPRRGGRALPKSGRYEQ
jgi:hypothetical protein